MAPGRLTTPSGLSSAADAFAQQVSSIVSAFTGVEHTFKALARGQRLSIRHDDEAGDKDGIPLCDGDNVLLTLLLEYKCSWDTGGRYLRVESSSCAVYPLDRTREPLLRYEYEREPQGRVPCAHLQVHAHRDAFTHLLGWGGPHSKRARRREERGLTRTPSVSEFHFPLGGPRFRPALEDVLDVLAEEFGLETGSRWPRVRDEARAAWRRTQVAASVRDAPEEAVRVLRELGYTVEGEPLDERQDYLTRL